MAGSGVKGAFVFTGTTVIALATDGHGLVISYERHRTVKEGSLIFARDGAKLATSATATSIVIVKIGNSCVYRVSTQCATVEGTRVQVSRTMWDLDFRGLREFVCFSRYFIFAWLGFRVRTASFVNLFPTSLVNIQFISSGWGTISSTKPEAKNIKYLIFDHIWDALVGDDNAILISTLLDWAIPFDRRARSAITESLSLHSGGFVLSGHLVRFVNCCLTRRSETRHAIALQTVSPWSREYSITRKPHNGYPGRSAVERLRF